MSEKLETKKDDLNFLYNSLIGEKNERNFLVEIYDYVGYVNENNEFNKGIKKLKSRESENRGRLKNIFSKFKKELNSVEKDILSIIKKDNLKINEIKIELNSLESIRKIEKKDFSKTDLIYKYNILVRILNLLHSNGIKKEISRYYTQKNDYNFSKFYNDFIGAVEVFEDNRKIALWNCWDKLRDIHSVFLFKEKRIVDKKQVEPLMVLNILALEDGQINESLKIDEIKLCVKRVHKYLIIEINKLLSKKIKKQEQKTKLTEVEIDFNDNEAKIIAGKKECKLPPFKNEHFLCRVMFNYEKGEFADWSDIFDNMDSRRNIDLFEINKKDGKKFKRAIQDAMYAINKRVKNKIKTEDNLFTWKENSMTRNY